MAAHHIIPLRLRSHPLIQRMGMDFDDATNGIFLPTTGNTISGLPSSNPFPRHRGNHPGYSNAIEELLDGVDPSKSIREIEADVFRIQIAAQRGLTIEGLPLIQSQGGTKDAWLKIIRKYL